ncbi:MAG: SAM-dependent methyltransferase [bacterium]
MMKTDILAEYQQVVAGSFSLHRLKERFPEQWDAISRELTPLCEPEESRKLASAMQRISMAADAYHSRVKKSRGNLAVIKTAFPFVIRHQMIRLWLTNAYLLSVSDYGKEGKARLSLWDGFIIQRLLFRQGLERKPVSMAWFKIVWALVRRKQRGLMLYLVQQKGIYCFYSDKLVKALAGLIENRPCMEIAAGDGTLTRFLRQEGVSVRATDNHAWTRDIDYPDFVEKLDAESALRKYAPAVVLCSWPPAGNNFEKSVFASSSVKLYIVIVSRKAFASGNWEVYKKQLEFEWQEDPVLSGLLLPPEVDGAVLVFRRKIHD